MALYYLVLNLITSLYLIIYQHIIAGVIVTLITIVIAILQQKNGQNNNNKQLTTIAPSNGTSLQEIANVIKNIPLNITITDINNDELATNIQPREILEVNDINGIFDSTYFKNNDRLFKNGEKILKAKVNNEIKQYYLDKKIIYDNNNDIIGYISVEFDLTEIIINQQNISRQSKMLEVLGPKLEEQISNEVRHRLDSQRRFKDLLDNNSDGILIFAYKVSESRVLAFVDSNLAARNLIQKYGVELKNIDIYDMFHASEKNRIESILRTKVSYKPILFETLINQQNNIVPVEISAHLSKLGSIDVLYLSLRDIRLRKQLELKRDRNRLIAIKEHRLELITSILSIIFTKVSKSTKLIKDKVDSIYSQHSINAEDIKNSAATVDDVIKNLMAFYAPTHIKAYIDIKNMVELVRSQIFFKEISNNTVINITQKDNIDEIYCEEDAIKYVISVLINNSMERININKGTKFYGRIDITIQEINSDYVLLSVEDNAGNIDHDVIGRVFDIFYPINTSATGLELPTCKIVVEEILLGNVLIANVNEGIRIDVQISK